MTRGRKPKPVSLHLLQGTFRRDRHADNSAGWNPGGRIVKPRELSPEASAIWDKLVRRLRPALASTDCEMLAMLCEFMALQSKALEAARKDATNRDARIALTSYSAMVDKIGSRFGLTPADRQRLKLPPDNAGSKLSKYTDPFEQLLHRKSAVSSRKRQ